MKNFYRLSIFIAFLTASFYASAGSTNSNAKGNIKVTFSKDNLTVDISSSPDNIDNVIINLSNGDQEAHYAVGKKKASFTSKTEIIGVWVKDKNNGAKTSSDSSGYGDYVMNSDSKTSSSTYQDKCSGKVKICHIPPGNPANRHTIWVSCNAASAHIKNHGDNYGECSPVTSTCKNPTDAKAKNISYIIGGKNYSTLRGNVNECDSVQVTFTTDSCTKPQRFSLVSYQAPDSVFNESTANQQVLYDSMSRVFTPGTHTLFVAVPCCDFQVDFVIGDVIETFGDSGSNGFYSKQDRLIDADNGGSGSCTISPLPVKMLNFTANQLEPKLVELKWATASEVNNDFFTIEKTTDMANWTPVCKVSGHGTTEEVHHYSCMDSSAGIATGDAVYYRPKQVDFNGQYEYFNTIKIRLQFNIEEANLNSDVTNVYPNPVSDGRINIRYDAKASSLVHIRVLTLEGKMMMNTHYNIEKGLQTIDLDLPENNLAKGVYLLEVENNGHVYRQKIYKQ